MLTSASITSEVDPKDLNKNRGARMSSSIFIYLTRPRMFRMAAVVYVRWSRSRMGFSWERAQR